jgi:hypothetical protein
MKTLLCSSAIAGLLSICLPAQATISFPCDPLANFLLTSGGRCINLDSLTPGGATQTQQQRGSGASQASFRAWEILDTAIAYQGDQGMRRVRITLRNGGTTAARPLAVQYAIVSQGNELYRGAIVNTSVFAPGQRLTLETLVGPSSLRGTRIADLQVEVVGLVD